MITLSQGSCAPCTPVLSFDLNDFESILNHQKVHYIPSENGIETSQQFCDACNSSCCLMKRNRKLQAKYEGFLLVKRLNTCSTSSKYARNKKYRATSALLPRTGASYQESSSDLRYRSYSFGELLNAEISSTGLGSNAPPRSISQVIQNETILEKLVNFSNEEKVVQLQMKNNSSPPPKEANKKSLWNTSTSKKHLSLSRTKSRSQDSLLSKSIQFLKSSETPEVETLNNCLPYSKETMKHSLSRSEGSIHNTTNGIQPQPPSSGNGSGSGRLWTEVEDFIKAPKKLFEKVTDEMGQITLHLERWKEEYIVLKNTAVVLRNSNGKDEVLVPYSQIINVQPVTQIGRSGHLHCLLLLCRKISFLMQASTSYVRDQWLHTLLWKRSSHKYRNLLKTATRPEVLLKALKNLVDLSLSTPLHDQSVCQVPLELTSSLLMHNDWMTGTTNEQVIITLAPLLENNRPSAEICSFFSKHCSDNPRSNLIIDMFTPVVKRILKHNVDFCTYPYVRRFTQDYIQALNCQNNGLKVVHKFVHDIHGTASSCPHLRVLPNLVSVCTSAICFILESMRIQDSVVNINKKEDISYHLECYSSTLGVISEYDDWRPGLALLLQPIPFPNYAFENKVFMEEICLVIKRLGTDPRCHVHQAMMASRENKDGWIQIISPSFLNSCDQMDTWISVLQVLLSCCCRRKKFLKLLLKSFSSFILLALREHTTAQEILCLMLEWQLIEDKDQIIQLVSTLQSTDSGKKKYQLFFDRQLHLSEIQQKSGPWKLSLPPRSNDMDVKKLLSSGPFGNLEILSLAFTRVTSACAEQLIQLSSLKQLDLWGTQFGDKGLQLISEHLRNLEVLNLCETLVTDNGLSSLTALKRLRKLNLNSTKVSLQMFEQLKDSLLNLEEVDLRYTEAW